MCFSATASFTAAAVLTAAGAATLSIAINRDLSTGERLLAAFPLVFGLQQASEGLVWLGIAGALPAWLYTPAIMLFVFTAYAFWPVAGPTVGWALEPRNWRRPVFAVLAVAGAAVAVYLAYGVITYPVTPMAGPDWGGHIWYASEFQAFRHIEIIYFFTACSALILSSNRTAFWFGVALAAGFAFTFALYRLEVLASVWCFFAAIGSLVIVVGFLRRPAPKLAV